MAREAKSNGPTDREIKSAFKNILGCHEELESERGKYMNRARKIRAGMAEVYDEAADKGITRKVLRAKVKKYFLEVRAAKCREDLEADAQAEFDDIETALGDYGTTELGAAAIAAARGNGGENADAADANA